MPDIVIRRLEQSDLYERVKLMNMPAIYTHMSFERPVSYSRTLKWFDSIDVKSRLDLVMLDKRRGSIIGFGGLSTVKNFKSELYVFLNPSYQGIGLGRMFVKAIIENGFANLDISAITLSVAAENYADKLYLSIGFKIVGVDDVTQRKYMEYTKLAGGV